MRTEIRELDECDPPFAGWRERLTGNLDSRQPIETRIQEIDFAAMRNEVIEAANEFTASLNTIADSVGLAVVNRPVWPPIEAGSGQQPKTIIATGHQPIIFHSGVIAKNLRLEQFASENESIGLMILIDTDEGDAGQFPFPGLGKPSLSVLNQSIGTGPAAYNLQTVNSENVLQEAKTKIVRSLVGVELELEAERSSEVLDQYIKLAGQSMVAANSIVRRLWEGSPNYIEIRLSSLVRLPSVVRFFDSIIQDGSRLVGIYNTVLEKFRQENHIRNQANPFPNLKFDKSSFELPFWIVDETTGARRPMTVQRANPQSLVDFDGIVVPRGMLVTTLLRLGVSDLFIHGTGGARYDRCTDLFIREWFGLDAPGYVATTSTRHLFSGQLDKLSQQNAALAHIKDAQSRFEFHVKSGTFTADDNVLAVELLERRNETIARFRTAKSTGQSAADINRDLKSVKTDIDSFVVNALGGTTGDDIPGSELIKVWENREFPFFMFAGPIEANHN